METIVIYHSHEWELLLSQRCHTNVGVWGWTTWSVDGIVATMKWTQF